MKELELSAKDLVRMAKIIVGLSDLYDNEESVKGCYECHDIFKSNVQRIYINSDMSSNERTMLCQISRDIRNERIAEIVEMHRGEDDDED